MSDGRSSSGRVVTWPARHPIATLMLTLIVAAVCAYRVSALRADAQLEALFDPQAATTRALHHVTHDFHGTDELLLLATATGNGDSAAAQQQRAEQLFAFAARFKRVVEADPQAVNLVRSVSYAADDSVRQFIEQVIVPNGLFYLDDAEFETFRGRLSPEGIAEQIARNEELVSLPVAATGPLAKMVLKDPLHLYEFLAPRLEQMRPPMRTWHGDEAYLSQDARSLLIRIVATQPAGDSDFTAALMAAAPQWAQAAEPGDLELAWSGAYAIADYSRTQIRADLIGCIIGSVVLMQMLFLLVDRRPWSFALAFMPVGLGVLVAFGVFSVGRDRVTPITAAIGGILAGMGIDYAIHYLSHYSAARAGGADPVQATDISGGVLGAMAAACGTSVAAFAAVAISDVPLLRDFAALGALGLAGTFIAAITLLPALLGLIDRGGRRGDPSLDQRLHVRSCLTWLDRHRAIAWPVAAVGLLALGSIWFARPQPWLESDAGVMHPQPNAPLAAQERITHSFSGASETMIVHMHADSPAALRGLIHEVDRRLQSPENRDMVLGVLSPAALLPNPQTVAPRQAALAQIDPDRVLADFRRAIERSAFSIDAYHEYEQFLMQLLRPGVAPDLATLAKFPGASSMMLPMAALGEGAAPPTQALAIVFIRDEFTGRTHRDRLIERMQGIFADLPGATPTGLSVAGYEMEQGVREDLPLIVAAAGAMVIIWVLVCLRSVKLALLASLPAVFGAVCLLGFMRAAGVKLNMVNMVALPILAGTAVDAGIFLAALASGYLRGQITRTSWLEQMAASLRAIALCSLTTMLGFGSLMLATTPAVSSLGLLMPVGMGAALAGCFFILTPLLLSLQPAHEGKIA